MELTVSKYSRTAGDDEIIDKVIRGEKDLYEILMRKYNQRLYRISKSYLKNESDIDDVMQDAYIKAYLNLKSFNRKSQFSTWLIRILINEALKRLNSSNKNVNISLDWLVDENLETYNTKVLTMNDNPENQFLSKELSQNLESAIQSVPINYRTVYIMREKEGMSISEIAESLGTTKNTVKIRLTRAKAMIKEKLYKDYKDVPLYEFMGERCDRIVDKVMLKIQNIGSNFNLDVTQPDFIA